MIRPVIFVTALVLIGSVLSACSKLDFGGCTLDRTDLEPAAVIEPCSKFLATEKLAPTARAQALFIRGRGYHRTKQLDLALKDYDGALELTPDDAEILVSRSNIFIRKRQFDAYAADVAHALKAAPHNVRVLTALGSFYRNSGRREEAIEAYSKALQIDANDAFALSSRMKMYWILKDYPKALVDADALVAVATEAAKTKPLAHYLNEDGTLRDFQVIALIDRADLLEKIGRFDRAEQDLNTAVAIDRSGLALYNRAQFYMGAEKNDAALADLQESIKREPHEAGPLYTLGLALMGQNKYDDAFQLFNRAIEERPGYGYALFMRARVNRQFGRTDAAVDDLMQAIMSDSRVLPMTMNSLRAAGYWLTRDNPEEMTPELADAFRACMIDVACN